MAYVNLLQVVYPVGAYYLSNSNTSPASLVGGTWTQLTGKTFLCGNASSGDTGGSIDQAITGDYLPRTVWYCSSYASSSINLSFEVDRGNTFGMNTVNSGSNIPLKRLPTLPPYRTCYMWYRTA